MPISLSSVLPFVHFLFIPVYKIQTKFNTPTASDLKNIISKMHVHYEVHINSLAPENIFLEKNK